LKLCLFKQLAIAECGGIEALIEILQETEKTEVRTVIGYLSVPFSTTMYLTSSLISFPFGTEKQFWAFYAIYRLLR